jgi:hypothetical protein
MIFAENRFPLFGIMREGSNQREYATRQTLQAHGQEGRLPFIKDALARRALFWKGRGVSLVPRSCRLRPCNRSSCC